MSTSVDLSQLAVERTASPTSQPSGPSRRWFSRYVLPLGLALAFGGLLAWAMRDSLLPAQPVTVMPVLVARAEVQQAGTPLFQAAGWVEPRPVATVVSSLTDGVVEELHVVEGQLVEKGEPIARLLNTDAQLRLREAQADLQAREADLLAAEAKLANAQLALRNPVKLRAALAEAESALAQLEAEVDGTPSAIEAAQIRWKLAQQNVTSKEAAGDAIAGRLLRESKSELAAAESTLKTLQSRQPSLVRQKTALENQRAALAEQLELKLEHRSRVADAQAAVSMAQAKVTRIQLQVETAELDLKRTVIKAPIDGRILSVQAPPGKRVNGLDPYSEQGSSAIVNLYDPAMLQVRVDVRLEDVPHVQLGQKVQIETAAVPEGLDGEVISVTSLADIQKNTLQVKAAISNPPDVVRPEMLGQVTFLAPELPQDRSEESTEKQRLLVPRQLVIGGEAGAHVWIADRVTKKARRQSVTLGRAGTDQLVEVTAGLSPTDKLITTGAESLDEGLRVRITGEDATLGSGGHVMTNSPRTASKSTPTTTN